MRKAELENTSNEIWKNVKTELLLSMRFLAPALSVLDLRLDLSTRTLGTDAESILYNPDYVLRTFVEDPSKLNRTYLHMLMHCMFRHMYRPIFCNDIEIWNLSCDIAVEHILDSMDYQCIYRVSSDFRDGWYEKLEHNVKVLTAERLYNYLYGKIIWTQGKDVPELEIIDERTFDKLCREFKLDDHSIWERLDDKASDDRDESVPEDIDMNMRLQLRRANKKEIEDAWKEVAKRVKSDVASLGDDKSTQTGNLSFYLKAEYSDKTYFTAFLDKIAVVREELRVDPDSFDYGLYNYGLELYGNMPLFEENEYSENHKIDELVIAIDTSASCSESLVQVFLNETAAILRRSDSFFRQIHVHIIECDNAVHNDILIKHPEEMEKYAENFKITGGYGTDFRPVFKYVDELRNKGELCSLRGLMYFTDGFGDYPKEPTDYDTAFVFPAGDNNDAAHMPDWAIELYIE